MAQRAAEATVELTALGYGVEKDAELVPASQEQQQQPLDAAAVLGHPSDDAPASPTPPKLVRQHSALGDAPAPPGSVMYQLAASPHANLHEMAELRAEHEMRKARADHATAEGEQEASASALRNFKQQAVSAAAAADAIASSCVAATRSHHRPSVFTFQGRVATAMPIIKPSTAIAAPVDVYASSSDNHDILHDQDMESVIRDELMKMHASKK